MGRHDTFLPISHTWKGIKKAIRRKSRGVFQIDEYTNLLPEKFFGKEISARKPWLPIKAYGLDLRYVLAKALLDADPSKFAFRPKPQTYGVRPDLLDLLDVTIKDGGNDVDNMEFHEDDECLLSIGLCGYTDCVYPVLSATTESWTAGRTSILSHPLQLKSSHGDAPRIFLLG
jgi:hypothetical protein